MQDSSRPGSIPPALKPGGTIAFISPSARLNTRLPAAISRARSVLLARGYKTRVFFKEDSDLSSSVTNRLAEIRDAFFDAEVSAVICTIGGGTFTELLPSLCSDKELCAHIRKHPKIVVGSSDMTGLHWFLNAHAKLQTFYGPSAIPELGANGDIAKKTSPLAFCVQYLLEAIATPKPLGDMPRSLFYAPEAPAYFADPNSVKEQAVVSTPGWRWLRNGKAQGRLFGGCLTVVVRLNGMSDIRPDWEDRIIFLETSMGEESRDLDVVRTAFADLIAQGVFEKPAGLVLGRPFGYDSDERRKEFENVFWEGLCLIPSQDFPVLCNVDFGHTTPMVTLPYYAMAELDSENNRFAILEAGVA
ncbi:peptidase u61 ld-carboxypeptidase a protein [Pochonia chlamydosporia 170]|uniref:Peptidase u61 ld-carboxypeptidase a protein n=1 Tax=Pochonia chlamydosporia 170 TaxID=1380566 RepID=A0A179FB02_METCM|nr:peptidase u61 ld-carboxypeptidase a protein [Pochonia chlamydosporia 170]OAQ62644.1 peptidase u61 ld-carboxypeptidase a protein [Pochonia chlamydosporia 170]